MTRRELATTRRTADADQAAVDAALANLSADDLALLFEQAVEDAGPIGRIYRRGGVDHPATRAAMARLLV
jgi:hypothetical protein